MIRPAFFLYMNTITELGPPVQLCATHRISLPLARTSWSHRTNTQTVGYNTRGSSTLYPCAFLPS